MADVISFRCPACKAERTVAKALAGRQARCPACDTLVSIPANPPANPAHAVKQHVPTKERPVSDERTVGDADIFRESKPEPEASWPREESTVSDARVSAERTMSDERTISNERTLAEEHSVAEDFDPYYRWLAIPPAEQPPHHYRLLGLQLYERDPDVIFNSSERQMAHVKAQAGGRNVVICQRLLSELSLARICLLDEKKKAAYDAELRRVLAARTRPTVAEKSAASTPRAKSPEHKTEKPAPQPAPVLLPLGPQAALAVEEPAAPPVQSPARVALVVPSVLADYTPEEPKEKIVVQRRVIEGEMDMTPMIDVTFLLLIFFICTASFALTMTKPIPAPKEDEPSTAAQSIEEIENDPDYITVRIDAYNTFRVITADSDEEAPSFQELIVKLRAARQGGPDGKVPTTLMVIANGEALYEKEVQALDAGTEVGMEKMQLMVVENDDE